MYSAMGSSFALAVMSAALAFQSASPALPVLLKPAGPWNVDYAENMCSLQRSFGGSSERIMLGFRPGILSDQMRMVIVRSANEKKTTRGDAQISFDGGAPVTARFAEGFVESKKVRATLIDLQDRDLAPLATARQMRIQAGKLDLIIAPNAVAAAMKALEACEKDLLVSWGMTSEEVATMATLAQHPTGVVSLFSTDDYPSSAVSKKEQGTAGVRFWIGPDGRASDCQVVESSGSQTLDDQTCSIMEKRARYSPARNNKGEVIRSIGFQRIRWEIP
jgi:TonB family protein